MDSNYNKIGAGTKLEELSMDRFNSSHSGTQLSRVNSASAHYEVVGEGSAWSLVRRNSNEELVVLFQGVIAKMDLPPFTERIGRASQHVKYMRQAVSVAGLETSLFERVVNAIADIHALLGRAVGVHNMHDCGMVSIVDGMRVVDLANRYFKPRRGGSEEDEVTLTADIDPHGCLAKAASSMGLYHSEENVVQFYERQGADDENYRYLNVKPIIFGVGDIVEVQASFSLFPLKDGKFKSSMVLRGLTLLDGSFTQDRIRNMVIKKAPAPLRRAIKRKVGYGDEELSSTRAKLMKMELDGDARSDRGEGSREDASVVFPSAQVSLD